MDTINTQPTSAYAARRGWGGARMVRARFGRLIGLSALLIAVAAPWQMAQAQAVCGEAAANCTAKEVTVETSVENPVACVIGSIAEVDVRFEATTETTRYDVGAWFNAPTGPSSLNTCQIYKAPSTSISGLSNFGDFENGADACGDFSKGTAFAVAQKVKVACQPDAAGGLSIPTTVYWQQNNNGAICNTTPGTVSKCKTLTTVSGATFLAQLTVTKSGGDGQSFPFTINPAASATNSFNLSNGQTQSMTPTVAVGGTSYTVTETADPNYTTVSSCTDRDTQASVATGTNVVTIPLSFAVNKVDCTFTNTKKPTAGTVTLTKIREGGSDVFGVSISTGASSATASLPTTSASSVSLANVTAGSTVNLSETGPLANYSSTLSCDGVTMTSNTGSSGSFVMPTPAGGVSCTLTNTRKTRNVTVRKMLNPASDTAKFSLLVNGSPVNSSAGHEGAGTTAVAVGTPVTVSETRADGSSIALHTPSLSCTGVTPSVGNPATSGSFTMPADQDVVCTFANTRKMTTIELRKAMDAADTSGKFNLAVTGAATATASAVSNGGTTGAVPVPVGEEVNLSETAAAGTDLAQYSSSLACSTAGANGVGVGVNANTGTTGTVVTGEQPVVCTFTNARKDSNNTVTVTKRLVPSDDPGKFTLLVNGQSSTTSVEIGNGGSTGAMAALVGSTVTVSEAAGSGFNLSSYSTELTCTAEGVTGLPSGLATTDVTFTMPNAPVSCVVTNTRKPTPLVTVTKSTSVIGALAPGGTVVYLVKVTNIGGAAASNVAVSDPMPAGIASQTWSCAAAGAASCGVASGTGSVTDTIPILPAGDSVTYTIIAKAGTDLPARVVNKVTITPPAGMACDPCAAEVSNPPNAIVGLTKVSSVTGTLPPGGDVTYTVVVTNNSAVAANNVMVNDPVPLGIASQTWICAPSAGATCTAGPVTGAVVDTVNLPVGGAVTYTITAKAGTTLPAQVTNKVTITPPPDVLCQINGIVTNPCEVAVSNPPEPPKPPAAVAPIPTTSPAGLVALALLVLGVAGAAARRKARQG